MNIYCMRWYIGEESPLTEDMPTNSRAEAMMEGSGKGAESRNKANGKDLVLRFLDERFEMNSDLVYKYGWEWRIDKYADRKANG